MFLYNQDLPRVWTAFQAQEESTLQMTRIQQTPVNNSSNLILFLLIFIRPDQMSFSFYWYGYSTGKHRTNQYFGGVLDSLQEHESDTMYHSRRFDVNSLEHAPNRVSGVLL